MQTSVALETFDGRNGAVLHRRCARLTRLDGAALDEHGAGTALAFAAAVFGAGELQRITQRREERIVWRDLGLTRCAVHLERDAHRTILASRPWGPAKAGHSR